MPIRGALELIILLIYLNGRAKLSHFAAKMIQVPLRATIATEEFALVSCE